jgi:hypothetical protein
MRLCQLVRDGASLVAASSGSNGRAHLVPHASSVRTLALEAVHNNRTLQQEVLARGEGAAVDLQAALAAAQIRAPIDHPDPAHLMVSGTGLTHLGSAAGRDAMHRDLLDPAKATDSMRMFELGVRGGKPAAGATGVQPEWFYKGDGGMVVAPEVPLLSPAFALNAGEEPEIAGIYVIGNQGEVHRIGFALGNDYSDHITEKENYLYLAHSKLRACAIGPEILIGELPQDIRGSSRIRRNGVAVWEKHFSSGEANMCHSIRNLEAHHFKYAAFRRPGDVHVHLFGTATLSFSDGFIARAGDVFEIAADPFGLPLRNPLQIAAPETIHVHAL